jgi:hypothetical protein
MARHQIIIGSTGVPPLSVAPDPELKNMGVPVDN